MTKEDTIEILDLIENILKRCTSDLCIPDSSGEHDYHSYIDPEKVRRAIQDVKSVIRLYGSET